MMTNASRHVENTLYDIAIIGGGLVGSCLLRSLAKLPVKIAVVEAVPHQSESQPSFDDRAIALSFGTRRIFEGLGLWESLSKIATPIKHIHISERHRFGVTRLHADQEQVDALGYVATARELGQTIVKDLLDQSNADFFMPAKLTGLKIESQQASLTLEHQNTSQFIQAKLVIAADGGHSTVRKLLAISAKVIDYQQTAIVANVCPQFAHNNIAYERFTRHGPLALLPMANNSMALVWTQNNKNLASIAPLDDQAFLHQLRLQMGHRLGAFIKVGKRQQYPLQLLQVRQQVQHRFALIGNAAHTLHPVAGQGFNLGLRDVAVMAHVLTEAVNEKQDMGALTVLNHYLQWRNQDHRKVIGFTHGLVKVFSNKLLPLMHARNLGLVVTDLMPLLKHELARQTMGLAGKLPPLSRGLRP